MKTAAHPLPHEPEWAAAIQKEVSPMNHITASLVTSEQPTVHLDDEGIEAIRFGADAARFTVLLPLHMSAADRASWCREFAAQLTDLATRIEHQNATVTA